MSNAHQLLFGLGIPAAIVLVLGFLWSLITKGNSAGVTIGLAAGLVQCFRVLMNTNYPSIKSVDPEPRVVVTVAAIALILAAVSIDKIPGLIRWFVMIVAPAAAVWAILSPLPTSSLPKEDLYRLLAIGGGASVILVFLVEMIGRRTGSASVALILGPWCAGAAAVLLMCGTQTLGWLTASLAVMLLGAFVVSLIAAPTVMTHGPVALVVTAVAALLAYGYVNPAVMTRTELGLLAGAPLVAMLAQIPPIGRAKPWKRELMRLVLILIPIGIAVGLAYVQFKKDSSSIEM